MSVTVRPATEADLVELGRMGAALARQHHEFDAERFMLPGQVEAGYRWWLGREMAQEGAVVIVAEKQGTVVGYAYGRIEERDWAMLRDRCGGFQDLWVEEGARGLGVGTQLAEEMIRRLKELGVPRIVLMTAVKNEAAQRLFARLGWRPTMLEMTREV